ncbi:MAG TPA: aldose 1-epimerase [Ktedonobacteraceae bacterium]|jgi:aldose 1-epimerase
MTSGNAKAPYSAEVVHDPILDTTAIALSYTDTSNPARNLLAYIAPKLGSNFYRLKVGEHELLHCEPEAFKKTGHTGTFVLWPFPNRVRDKQYTYRGQHYTFDGVPRNQGALIHGLVFDRVWSYEPPVADEQAASVTTFVEMNADSPYYSAYPFASRLALTYTLTSTGITITYSVRNTGTQPLPYGFALHPYFHQFSSPERTLVTLPAGAVMEADQELLPTGRLLDVQSVMYKMFDLNQPTPVSHLKLDHVYTRHPAAHEALIEHCDHGLRVRLAASADFTHTVIYTLGDGPYLCLENQTCSTDAINLFNNDRQDIAHLLEVQPGAESSGFIRFTVEYA